MYRILIVEDEILVSVGLRSMIQAMNADYEIIGEARNGQEALSLYHRQKPDIILTDIRMPGMNGLELIKQIRAEDSRTKIVVLSCYDDFDLVKQSFQLGISDYIHKMKMSPDEVGNVLKKICQELLPQKKQFGEEETLPSERSAAAVLREGILQQSCNTDAFAEAAQLLHIRPERLSLTLLALNSAKKEKKSESYAEENKRQMVCGLIQEMLPPEWDGIVMPETQNRYLLLMNIPGALDNAESALEGVLQDVQTTLFRYISGGSLLGISTLDNGYDALSRLYSEAVQALQNAVFFEIPYFQYGKVSEEAKLGDVLKLLICENNAFPWITELCKHKLQEDILLLMNTFSQGAYAIKRAFIRWVHWIFYDCILQTDNVLSIVSQTVHALEMASTISECHHIYSEYMKALLDDKANRTVRTEVAQTIAYIKAHYSKYDLSLPEVAKEVGLNKDYLGSLFRKETGLGFSDFVNQTRINRACDLLKTTNMKVCEIAWNVGVADESYFCRVFKRLVGMSPRNYKRHGDAHE